MGQVTSTIDESQPEIDEFLSRCNVKDDIRPLKLDANTNNLPVAQFTAGADYEGVLEKLRKKNYRQEEEAPADTFFDALAKANANFHESSSSDSDADANGPRGIHYSKRTRNLESDENKLSEICRPSTHPIYIDDPPYIGTELRVIDHSSYCDQYPILQYYWEVSEQPADDYNFVPAQTADSSTKLLTPDLLGRYIRVTCHRTVIENKLFSGYDETAKDLVDIFDMTHQRRREVRVSSIVTVGPVTINPETYAERYSSPETYNFKVKVLNYAALLTAEKSTIPELTVQQAKAGWSKARSLGLCFKAPIRFSMNHFYIVQADVNLLVDQDRRYNWLLAYASGEYLKIPNDHFAFVYCANGSDIIAIQPTTEDQDLRLPILLEGTFDTWVLLELFHAYTMYGDMAIEELMLAAVSNSQVPLLLRCLPSSV